MAVLVEAVESFGFSNRARGPIHVIKIGVAEFFELHDGK